MALPRISRGLALPSGRTTTVTPTDAETDGNDDETREVPIPVPPDVSEEEVQEAADAAAEALPEDTEAVVGERDPEPEPSPEPDEMQRTIEELRSTGDPNEVQRTPVLESGNIDVAPDEWQLGFPLQGIPRLAAVLNLNYQYSESRDRWEREETGPDSGPTRRFAVKSNLDSFPIDSRTFFVDEARRYHSISASVIQQDVQDGPVLLEVALGTPVSALSPSSGNIETVDKSGVEHAFMLGRSSSDSTGGPGAETITLGGGDGVTLDADHELAYFIRGESAQTVKLRLNYTPL